MEAAGPDIRSDWCAHWRQQWMWPTLPSSGSVRGDRRRTVQVRRRQADRADACAMIGGASRRVLWNGKSGATQATNGPDAPGALGRRRADGWLCAAACHSLAPGNPDRMFFIDCLFGNRIEPKNADIVPPLREITLSCITRIQHTHVRCFASLRLVHHRMIFGKNKKNCSFDCHRKARRRGLDHSRGR